MELLRKNGYVLRAPEPEDLASMMLFENTPSLWEVSTPSGPYSRFYLKQYIEQNKNDIYIDRQLRLMIETPRKDVAGIIDLFNFDPFHRRAEVGVVVADAYRKQGIATQALELLKQFSFDYLGIHQLYAFIGEDNGASRRLFAKCGFEECGFLKDWMRTGEDFRNVVIVQCRRC